VGALFFITYHPTDDVTLAEFIVGSVIIWSIAAPIGQTIILAYFSNIVGSRPQVRTKFNVDRDIDM
jgi:hypothetical protein